MPTSKRFRELLKQYREAVNAETWSRWIQGDIALELAPIGAGHDDRLEQLVTEGGGSLAALTLCREVSAGWPVETRVDTAGWSVHRELLSRPDRATWLAEFARGRRRVTVDAVRIATDRKPTRYAPPHRSERPTPVTAEEVVAALAARPDLARAVALDDAALDAVEEARLETRVGSEPVEAGLGRARNARASSGRAAGDDIALGALRQATSAMGEAAFLKEEYGVMNTDEERALLERHDRYRAAYGADGEMTDEDREWAEANGVAL